MLHINLSLRPFLKTLSPLFILISACSLSAADGLVFEKQEHTFRSQPGQTAETALFRFTNTSEQEIRIESVRASCGCTAPELKKRVYAPGESGEVKAIFTFGSRVGEQRKPVVVKTSEPATYQLTIRGTIPELVRLQPRMVRWSLGEEPMVKTISIEVSPEAHLRFVDLEPSNGDFAVQASPGEKEGQQIVSLIPKSTEKQTRASINARFENAEGETVLHRLYAFVR
jgi:hypothetical protein